MSFDFTQLKSSLTQTEENLLNEFKCISTGRAVPQVLDFVMIEQYGSRTQISHVASISLEDARTLRVTPWDKGIMNALEKAINEADLGLSVSSDDQGLRVHFPTLTGETRQKLVKIVKERFEDARIRIRSAREETNKAIEIATKEGAFGDDEKKRYREEVQKLVDERNVTLESLFKKKESEVMS